MLSLIDRMEDLKNQHALFSKMLLKGKARFLLSILIVLSAKIIAIFFIYYRLSILGGFHTHWMSLWGEVGPEQDWLYLFSAWDTGFYIQIAENWYSYPAYAFFPAYPVFIRILSFMIKDSWLSAFILSFVTGIACVPAFQALAEEYQSRMGAFTSTMVMSFFPYVFLFTTMAYTESLFLLSSVLTWYFYRKGKLTSAGLTACIATLSKIYGIFILIPILVDILYNRSFKKMLNFSFPIFAILSWLSYLFYTTGDWLMFMTSQQYWRELGMEFNWIRSYLQPLLAFDTWRLSTFNYILIAFIAIFAFIIFGTLNLDWRLGTYAIAMYFSLLYFSNFLSLPRFLSFIFPIWLKSRLENPLLLIMIIPFFTLISLLIWFQFLVGGWIA